MIMQAKFSTLALAVAASVSFSGVAQTDESAIERIQISGDFKTESLSRYSGSATLLDQETLAKQGAKALDEALTSLANVNFTAGASRGRFVQIRGIGLRSQFVDPINPSVGLVIDGINYSGLGGAALLFDTSHVTVYRGPHGTQFGNDALAGMIAIDSQRALDQNAYLEVGAGNYGAHHAGFAAGVALEDNSQMRVSLFKNRSNGYMENAFTGRDDSAKLDETAFKFNGDFNLTADTQLSVTAHSLKTQNGYNGFTLDNSRVSTADEQGMDNLDSQAFAATLQFSQLDNMDVAIKVSQLEANSHYSYDEDWTCAAENNPLCAGTHPWGYSSFDRYLRDHNRTEMDVRFSGKQKDWVVGIYSARKDVDFTRQYTYLDADFGSAFEQDNFAIYAHKETALGEKTRLITGLRAERTEFTYQDTNGFDVPGDDWMWGAKLAVEQDVTANTMLYTSLSRSYKVGGVNGEALAKARDEGLSNDADFFAAHQTFAPEYLWNAEFGVKGSSDDGKVSVRAAAFYAYRDNVQLKAWNIQTNDTQPNAFAGYLDNAASGENYGLEVEMRRRLSDTLVLNTSLGYLNTEIDGFVTQDGQDISGREQAQAPKYTYAVGLEYTPIYDLSFNLGITGKDDYYFSNSHDEQAPSQNLVNLGARYQGNNWTLTAYMRNAFNDDEPVRGFYFGNDPRDFYEAKQYVQYGEPRVYGVTLGFQF